MAILILGLALLVGVHFLPVVGDTKERLRQTLGDAGYKIGFSLISLAGLVLVIWGYGAARAEGSPVLYDPPSWTRHLAMLLMIPVFVLLVSAYVPGKIRRAVKHPMFLALKIWACAHLLANGDLASVLIFVSILGWAVAARIIAKRRDRSSAGVAGLARAGYDALALGLGLAIYGLFVWKAHFWLIGVPII